MKINAVKIILVYIMLCFIWGSTWLAIRFGLESLTPMFSAGLRFLLASLLIFSMMKLRGVRLQSDIISIRLYLVMGFLSFVIPFGLVYWAEQFVPSGLASVLFAVFPFFVVIYSYYFIKDASIDVFKITGIFLGFSGVVVIFSDQFSGEITDYLIGMIAIVLSAMMQAGIVVTIKKYGNHLHPLSMNFIPMLIAGVSMLSIGIVFEDISNNTLELSGVLSIFYLALFGSLLTFTSYYWLLKKINIVILSFTAFITPITALILGYLIYDEKLSSGDFFGSALVLVGVFAANIGNLRRLRRTPVFKPDG